MPPLAEIPLVGGVDTRSDPRHVPLGKLLRGENASTAKLGAYQKRYGNTSVPVLDQHSFQIGRTGTSPLTTLADYKGRLLAMSRTTAWTKSQADKWTQLGGNSVLGTTEFTIPQFTADERAIAQASTNNFDGDMAINSINGMRCYVWTTSGALSGNPVMCTITDDTTGALLLGPVKVDAGMVQPKVRSLGNSFLITYSDGAGIIHARRVDLTTYPIALGGVVSLFTDARVAPNFAWDAVVDTSRMYLVYENNAGVGVANRVTVRSFSEALVLQTTATPTDLTNVPLNSIGASVGASLWYAYTSFDGGSSRVRAARLNPTTLATLAAPVIISTDFASADVGTVTILELQGFVSGGNATALVAWSYALENATRAIWIDSTCAAPAGAVVHRHYRAQLVSRLWGQPTSVFPSVYAVVTLSIVDSNTGIPFGSDSQGSVIVLDFTEALENPAGTLGPLQPTCVVDPRQSYGPGMSRTTYQAPANVALDGAAKVHTVTTKAASTTQRRNIVDLKLDDDLSLRQTAMLGDLLYVSGGIPSWTDGVKFAEAGFIQYPRVTGTSGVGGDNHLVPGSTYAYAVIFSQYDNQGSIHRSAPFFFTITLGGADTSVSLTVSELNHTNRQIPRPGLADAEPVRREIYRDMPGDNPPIYRQISADIAPATDLVSLDSYVFPLDFLDGSADATGGALLYTTGGVLDNINPPSARLVCAHRDRLFFAGCPNGREIWASQKLAPGVAPGFNEGLIVYAPFDVTALLSMDDKLVIFGSDAIAILTGDGPTPNGSNSDWLVIPVATSIGAVSPTVCLTPIGAVFQSRSGIALISRGLEVKPDFGAPVEGLLAAFPIIRYAVLKTDEYQVRIGCRSNANAGVELRYDFRQDCWLETKYWDAGVYGAGIVSACMSNGTFYWLSAVGNVYREDTTTWLDAGAYVPMTLEFAAVGVSGTQGYQGARSANILGDKKSAHDLLLEVSYDYASYAESKSFGDALTATWSTYQIEYSFKRGKEQALRLRLSDATPTGGAGVGTGQGPVISSVTFDVYQKEGAARQLPATQRA